MSTLPWFKGIINTIGRVLFFHMPSTEDNMLDWDMVFYINAARHTTSIPTGEIWLDEDWNPVPYNDGIVAEYPQM